MRAQPELVAGKTIELGKDDSNVIGARRGFDVQQFFNRLALP